jgi:hypothetical protein
VGRALVMGAVLGLVSVFAGAGGAGGIRANADAGEIRLATATIDDLMAGAHARVAAGDAAGADALLRRALRLDVRDPRPADLLREIYDGRGVRLPVDDGAVGDALAQLGAGSWSMETEHFVIVSNADRAWTQGRASMLERAYDEVHRFGGRIGVRMHPPEAKLVCVLVGRHDQYEALALEHDGVRASWVSGYYASASNRIVFYDDSTGPAFVAAKARLEEARGRAPRGNREAEVALEAEDSRIDGAALAASTAKTVHEAAHLVAYNCGMQSRARQAPFWFTEGLATNFETPTGAGRLGPESPVEFREAEFAALLARGGAMPVAQFVGVLEAPEDDRARAGDMYAQAYALFRFLARTDREALGGFARDLLSEPAGESTPERMRELFRDRFGPAEAVERRWVKFETSR